jgi:hypothetical protein
MAAEKINDTLKTLLSANFQGRARSLWIGTAQEIGSLFESIQSTDTDIRSIQQSGKFHGAEQLMLGPERVYGGHHGNGPGAAFPYMARWQLLNTETKFARRRPVKLTQQPLIIMIRRDVPVFPPG